MNQNRVNVFAFILAAGLALLALSACVAGGGDAAPEQPRTVSVTGTGTAYGKPDMAVAQIGVQTRHEDPAAAVGDNNRRSEAITAALVALGVDEKDIQTANFSVYPQQDFDERGQVTRLTYVVDNTLTVTVRDLDKVGDLLGQAVDNGANNIFGVSFGVSDQSALMAEARGQAIADARARAEQLASAAGVTLGRPTSIVEVAGGPIVLERAVADGRGGGVVGPVPVSVGQIMVSLQVTVTYLIE